MSLYFRHDTLDSDVAWLRDNGYRVEALGCDGWAAGVSRSSMMGSVLRRRSTGPRGANERAIDPATASY